MHRNQKKNNIILFLLMMFGMFLGSCKGPLNLKDDLLNAQKAYITISTNLSDSEARTVLPTNSFTETSTGLTWTLKGKKQGNTTETSLGTWNDTKEQTGAVISTALSNMQATTISVEVGAWDFTLTVTNESGKVLEGELQNQSISSTNATLSFIMKAPVAGTDVATGGIDFTLSFPQNVVNKVEACLKYGDNFSYELKANYQCVINEENDNVTYTKTDIPAGYYMLQLDLYQQDPVGVTFEKLEHINTYTTLVRVAPGLCSTGEDRLNSLAQLYKINYCDSSRSADGSYPIITEFKDTSNVTLSYNAYTTFALPTPKKEGYDFTGWYTNEHMTSDPLAAGSTYSITRDTTLYAGWEVSTNNGETPGGESGANGDEINVNNVSSSDLTLGSVAVNGGNVQTLTVNTKKGWKYIEALINDNKSLTWLNEWGGSNGSVSSSAGVIIKLAYDLELDNYVPLGKENQTSFFIFDGQEHTITIKSFDASVTNYAALFGYVGNQTDGQMRISNLVVAGPKDNNGQDVAIETSAQYAGGIVAYSNGVTITNCVNKLSINSNSSANSYVGGIVGYAAMPTTITSCVNFAELQATYAVGGIIGQAYCSNTDNGDFSVNKCINVGNIYSNEANAFVSGIFGYSNIAGNTKIEDCINLGTVGWKGSAQSLNASGIATIYSGTPTINRCINTELVKSSSTRFAIANIDSYIIEEGSFYSLYYDSTKWKYFDFSGKESEYNCEDKSLIGAKSTSELCTLKANDLSQEWSFAAEGDNTRYPLPDLSGVFVSSSGGESIWDQICVAAQIQDSASAAVKPSDL